MRKVASSVAIVYLALIGSATAQMLPVGHAQPTADRIRPSDDSVRCFPSGATGPLSVTAAAREITVTGALPQGETTSTVTFFVLDTTNNTVVAQILLPNAVKQNTSVSLAVKVASASASYAIGTFEENGFQVSSYLRVSCKCCL